MANNINEQICEAVDIIVSERLQSIQFDRTILCSVVDASNSSEGKYVVATISSNSNVIDLSETDVTSSTYIENLTQIQNTFEAYSTESYSAGQYVYVLVPEGDFSQQKTIIGKYVTDSNEPYIVSSPFEEFVDMTGNLVSTNKTYGLVANSNKEICNTGTYLDTSPTISVTFPNPLKAFTRLGLKASFSTRLSGQKCIIGSYGIQAILTVENISYSDTNEETVTRKEVTIDLNSSNFIGNPYSLEGSYYNQELVFDVSAYSSIKAIDLYFYQRQGTFKDENYIDLSWQDQYGHTIPANLKVKNVYVGVGYDKSEVDKDTLFLYTFDETSYEQTFDPTTHEAYPMRRNLKVRWIHKDETTGRYETVSDLSTLNTTERTSAILSADSDMFELGSSLCDTSKVKIETNFYNAYLGAMSDYIEKVASGTNVGENFNYVLQNNPNGTPQEYTMTQAIRDSFIDDLEDVVKNLFQQLNIYTWCQEQVSSFVSASNDLSKYYRTEDATTKDPPYYKYKKEQYDTQFASLLEAIESGGAAQNEIARDTEFRVSAQLDDGTKIYIIYKIPQNFSSNCFVPFWRDLIDNAQKTVNSVYEENQTIISSYQYQLRWYHYRLGATISDSDVYAGADWRRIDKDFLIDDTLLDPEPEFLTNQFEFDFTPNPNKRQEQFKCILIIGYNEDKDGNALTFDYAQSKVFTFSNRGRVIDVDTIEKVEALSIYCKDDTFGNYFIYSLGGDITNTTESQEIRYLQAMFNPGADTDETAPLREAQTITWNFPLSNYSYENEFGKIVTINGYTMISPVISVQTIESLVDLTEEKNDSSKIYTITEDTLIQKVYTRKKQRYQYDTLGDITDEYPDVFTIDISGQKLIYTYKCFSDGSIYNSFGYMISNFYSQQKTVNNTVGCSIVKDFVTYNAAKTLNFGPSGTQGAEVSLVVNFTRDKNTLYNAITQIEHIQEDGSITVGLDDFRPARFSAYLYDAEANLVDISDSIISCEWSDTTGVYKNDLNRWFVIQECKDENNKWLNNIPTWEIHYSNNQNSGADGYQEKKIETPLFEQVTSESSTEAIELANSVKNARVNAIVAITISNYGRYDKLKTFLPIPQKSIYHQVNEDISFIPGYISGPTQVIYDGTGHSEYYKGPYTMSAFVQGSWRNNMKGSWSLIYASDVDTTDVNYLPSLSSNAILEPLGLYISNAPHYGVAFSSSGFNLTSNAVGKSFMVKDLSQGDITVERLMTQELWDFINSFVNTPVNKLQDLNFVCSFEPTDNMTSFSWNPGREENSQILANLFHGIFPHSGDLYNLYEGFITGKGKTYGWRIGCQVARDQVTGENYYYKMTFSKSRDNVLDTEKDSYNDVSDPNDPAEFLQGFLSYFKSTTLHIGAGTNCWFQPIYIGQNRYMSSTLNKWDGQSLQIDGENCEIIAHAVAAGKKETSAEGNSVFTGVIIGQVGSDASPELKEHTGVYGINQGAMAYQFLDNGTGFIGQSGRGRIEFDGNTGTIKSGLYDASAEIPIGSIIDFDDGRIELHGSTTSVSWNSGSSDTTSNSLVLPNASEPLELQVGPTFGGTETEQPGGDDEITEEETGGASSIVKAVFNSNRLTLTVRKAYLYNDMNTEPTWNPKFENYRFVVVVGKAPIYDTNGNIIEGKESVLQPIMFKCVTLSAIRTINKLIQNLYFTEPLITYKSIGEDEEGELTNYINFSSQLEMLLETFSINYYLCGIKTKNEEDPTKNTYQTLFSILHGTENTESYDQVNEGQYLDTSATNSYNTSYKKIMESADQNIYGVVFEIPVKDTFQKFFENMGTALSTTLSFSLNLTRRTVCTVEQNSSSTAAVGALVLDAGTLRISEGTGAPAGYTSSGTPLSIGIINGTLPGPNEPLEDIHTDVNFKVDWDGTMHARNGYFTNQSGSNYIRISSDPSVVYPFRIGKNGQENFRVDWNGNLQAKDCQFENGYFEGEIEADKGCIGGWTIKEGYLVNSMNTIQLDADHGVINGPVLRGAEIRGGAIFTNDLHTNYFTIYNFDTNEDGDVNGLQGDYDTEVGLVPPTSTRFLSMIKNSKVGTIGLIISSDGDYTTYPLGMQSIKGSIVLEVKENTSQGSTENIRLTVPRKGGVIANVLNGATNESLLVMTRGGIYWGQDWGNSKFEIMCQQYLANNEAPSLDTYDCKFKALNSFKVLDTYSVKFSSQVDDATNDISHNPSNQQTFTIRHYGTVDFSDIRTWQIVGSPSTADKSGTAWTNIVIKRINLVDIEDFTQFAIIGSNGATLTVSGIPAENQSGIYARFA